MITLHARGNFDRLDSFLEKALEAVKLGRLDKYGRRGVAALKDATPVDTGETASSWYYKISRDDDITRLTFYNSNIQNGCPIAIILQYGHMANGVWVEGRDYINPAIQPIFDEIAKNAWKEVTST